MRTLPLLLLALPLSAVAAPLDWGLDGASAVEIAGPVEVPLLRGAQTNYLPTVEATAPGATPEDAVVAGVMVVDLGGGWSQVDAGLVKKLGLKSKKSKINGTPVEMVVIPELRIGAMTLRNVRAMVNAGPSRLGVGTLPEIAAAILPTSGTVKFVPAAAADQLLAEIGTSIPVWRVRARQYYEFGKKQTGNGVSSYVDGTILGQKGQFYLRTYSTTKVDENIVIPPGHTVAGLPVAEDTPALSGVTLSPVLVQHSGAVYDPKGKVAGVIGYDALYGSDIAYSPSSNVIAVRKAAAQKSTRVEGRTVQIAKDTFDIAEKKASEDKTEAPAKVLDEGGDPGDSAATGRHTALAAAYEKALQWPAAIAEYEIAAKTAGDHCEPYLALGNALLASGQPEAAIPPLTHAGTLFDKWYGQNLESREAIVVGRKVPGLFAIVQAPTCNAAWSKLATAQLALGKHDAVAKIYHDHNGTDPDVPFAYGLSLLVSGRADAADGPLREAINMGGRSDVDVRSALSVASSQSGATAVANAQIDVIARAVNPSLAALLPHIEGLRAAGGDAAALAGAKAAVAHAPWSTAAQLLLVREHKRGASADLAAAQARLDALVDWETGYYAFQPSALARQAASRALAGDAEGAKAWFATALWDGSADFWAAKAVALEGTSDAKEAVDAATRATLTALPSVKLGG